MTAGERIKEARILAGMTQKELAAKLGIPYQGIGQWERDIRTPRVNTLEKIADALGVSVSYLLGDCSMEELKADRKVQDELQKLVTDDNAAYLATKLSMPIEHIKGQIADPRTDGGMRLTRILLRAEIKKCLAEIPDGLDISSAVVPDKVSELARKLMDYFNSLNDVGKAKALERVEELTELQKYRA